MIGINLDKNPNIVLHKQCFLCGRPATPDSGGKINYLDKGNDSPQPICPKCLENWVQGEGVWAK